MPSRRVSVRETMDRDGPRISFIMEIDNGARLFDAIDSVILFFLLFSFYASIYGLTKCQREPRMGSQLRRSRPHCGGIEATSLGVRAIEIAQAVDRKIGPRPPMRAVSYLPNNLSQNASRRVVFVKRWGAREKRPGKSKRTESSISCVPRENLICREDRSSESNLTASYWQEN